MEPKHFKFNAWHPEPTPCRICYAAALDVHAITYSLVLLGLGKAASERHFTESQTNAERKQLKIEIT